MEPAPPPARLAWIDAARTVACALVVLVHVNIYYRAGANSWWPGGFSGVPFFGLAVPAFFLIAGYVSPGPPRLARRLAKLLPAFYAWNAILVVTGSQGRDLAASEVVFYLLTGANQLYFIFALVQLLVLHRLLAPKWLGWGAAIATLAFYAAADAAVWTRGAASEIFTLYLNRSFAAWAVFYAAGVLLARRPGLLEGLWRKRAILVAAAVVTYAAYVAELRAEDRVLSFNPVLQFLVPGLPFQLVGAVLLLLALRRLEASPRTKPAVLWLAAAAPDTFGIYLSHVSVQAALFGLWVRAGHEGAHWTEVPILAAASWIVCQLATRAGRALRESLYLRFRRE
ncbi:MAG: acyltransferase [Thermoanaerobaculia bacterium]|nr:acyltransferase [Thermoanaerobaculia bacterium]